VHQHLTTTHNSKISLVTTLAFPAPFVKLLQLLCERYNHVMTIPEQPKMHEQTSTNLKLPTQNPTPYQAQLLTQQNAILAGATRLVTDPKGR
jgi:hypothetical protein